MKRYHQVMNIVVIGVGYVGLITGLWLSHLNHKVQFVDIDSEKIKKLNDKISPFYEPKLDEYLNDEVVNKNVTFCDNYDEIVERGQFLENGIIHFYIKDLKLVGACGVGLMGKIGRDIRIASKLIEKNITIDKRILSNENQKLNILIKNK